MISCPHVFVKPDELPRITSGQSVPTLAAQLLVMSVTPLSMRNLPSTHSLPILFVMPSAGASAVIPDQLETGFRTAFSPMTAPRIRPT